MQYFYDKNIFFILPIVYLLSDSSNNIPEIYAFKSVENEKAGVLNVVVGCWMLNAICIFWLFPKEEAPVNLYAEHTAARSLLYIGRGWSNRKYNPKEVDLTCVKRSKRCCKLADRKADRKGKMKWRPWVRNLFWRTVSAVTVHSVHSNALRDAQKSCKAWFRAAILGFSVNFVHKKRLAERYQWTVTISELLKCRIVIHLVFCNLSCYYKSVTIFWFKL